MHINKNPKKRVRMPSLLKKKMPQQAIKRLEKSIKMPAFVRERPSAQSDEKTVKKDPKNMAKGTILDFMKKGKEQETINPPQTAPKALASA